MAIKIVNAEPVNKPPAVDKKLGRPKVHPDRAVYQRDWMRQRRVQDRVDAILLAQMD
jgi:hypothetical protein